MAPPIKLTPELIKRMGDLFRLGMSQVQVAKFYHLSPQTLRRWIHKGKRQKKGLYADLVGAMNHGEAAAVRDCLVNLHRAHVDGNKWQAAAWYLERKHPEEWADRGPGIREIDRLYAKMVRGASTPDVEGTGPEAGPADPGKKAGPR